VADPNDFRDPDYLSVPALSTGVPTTNAGRVVSVTERQDDLRRKAKSQAKEAARPNFTSGRSGDEMNWDNLGGYPLLFASGNLIELTFSEGAEREESEDLGTVHGLDEKSKGMRTHHPSYHVESKKLSSSINIRRDSKGMSTVNALDKATRKGVEALEQASDEADSIIVDALLSGGYYAMGVRYATSGKGEIFETKFFHDCPFPEVESAVLNWIQGSLENQVFERRREDEDFSSLQEPIAEFGKAMEKSDSEVSVADGDEDLSYRTRAFASAISNE